MSVCWVHGDAHHRAVHVYPKDKDTHAEQRDDGLSESVDDWYQSDGLRKGNMQLDGFLIVDQARWAHFAQVDVFYRTERIGGGARRHFGFVRRAVVDRT